MTVMPHGYLSQTFPWRSPRGDHMSLLVSVVCTNRQSCQERRGGGREGGPAEDKSGMKTSRRAYRCDEPRTRPKIALLPALFLRNSPCRSRRQRFFGQFFHSFDSRLPVSCSVCLQVLQLPSSQTFFFRRCVSSAHRCQTLFIYRYINAVIWIRSVLDGRAVDSRR